MPNETVELLFKFVNQGSDQLDRAAASVDKVVSGSGKATPSIQGLERQLGGAGKEADRTGRSFDALSDKIRNGLQNPIYSATGALEGFVGKLGKVGGIASAVAIVGGRRRQASSESHRATGRGCRAERELRRQARYHCGTRGAASGAGRNRRGECRGAGRRGARPVGCAGRPRRHGRKDYRRSARTGRRDLGNHGRAAATRCGPARCAGGAVAY